MADGHAYKQAGCIVSFTAAVAAYRAAGMSLLGEVRDFCRP